MSGGHFDYEDMKLFTLLVENTDDDLLKGLLEILGDWVHAYDWCVSGDTSQEIYLKEREQAILRLKQKLKGASNDNNTH